MGVTNPSVVLMHQVEEWGMEVGKGGIIHVLPYSHGYCSENISSMQTLKSYSFMLYLLHLSYSFKQLDGLHFILEGEFTLIMFFVCEHRVLAFT